MHQRSLTEDGIVSPLKPAKPEKPAEKAAPEDGTLSTESLVKMNDVAVNSALALDPGVQRKRKRLILVDSGVEVAVNI